MQRAELALIHFIGMDGCALRRIVKLRGEDIAQGVALGRAANDSACR
jgi:hypothetical protein